jgi:hypothetical protein
MGLDSNFPDAFLQIASNILLVTIYIHAGDGSNWKESLMIVAVSLAELAWIAVFVIAGALIVARTWWWRKR